MSGKSHSPVCFRRESSRSVSLYLIAIRVLFVSIAPVRCRGRGDDVGDSRVIHFFVKCGKILLRNFLHLRGSIVHQRGQLGQFFLLLSPRRGGKAVQLFQQILHLLRERVGLPFERGTCIAQSFPFARVLLGDGVNFLLQFLRSFLDLFGYLRSIRLGGIFLPLFARGFQRFLDPSDSFAVLVRALGYRVERLDGFAASRAVGIAHRDPRVVLHRHLLLGRLLSCLDLHGVYAGLHQWSSRTKTKSCRLCLELLRRGFGRWIPAQVPIRPVHPRRAWPVKFTNQIPALIEHGDFYFAFFFHRGCRFRFVLLSVFGFIVFVDLGSFGWDRFL